ncbi:hypothetical protein TRFO_15334 [Tritrichomonas foetus]|uniref:HYDIN/VesB/CFA65-like Ig-like domain-containing protein n=1 Tax=Tritrichomonas foetus TaxID=1144522 RepID=A0A1J4KXM3_9EUKA|nr:hypothetical protein TRFO_15334 [Tritrichomonas foetus]|eukprot:OHT14309.1 hypothetical protein TRFO_15334 [Tritrichomonas foetus]
MAQDFTVNSVICTLDIIQNAIDFGQLADYIKTNFKKEIVFLNAQDFAEGGGRASKADAKGGGKAKHDSSAGIVKGFKSRIDSDVSKILDAKKKLFAAQEKAKNSTKSGKKSRSSNKDGGNNADDSNKPGQLFDGRIDILYIVTNYPYLPKQLATLTESGVDLNVFLSVLPKNGYVNKGEEGIELNYIQNVSSTYGLKNVHSRYGDISQSPSHDLASATDVNASNTPNEETHKKGNEKSARVPQKKSNIPGQELDSSSNPNIYPPARWAALKPSASSHVVFEDVYAGDDVESTFKNLEEKLVLISKAREDFNNFFQGKSLINLPSPPNIGGCTLDNFTEYMVERPGDFVNALYHELRSNKYTTAQPTPPPPSHDLYEGIFKDGMNELDRKVIFLEPREMNDMFFNFELPCSLHSLLYRLVNWSLSGENVAACSALSEFIGSPPNFYAYAGQRFDTIVQSTNKKYGLNLPMSFFDWSQWTSLTEYIQIGDALADAIHYAGLIETYFDEPLGMLWVLTLPPVPRTMGQFMSHYSMPQTIDGITEYIERLYNKNIIPERKARAPPSPAQVLRDNLDFNVLIPPLSQRMADSSSYYKLPVSISNSASFNAPYYFESGLKVDIMRELENEKLTFQYNAYYKQLFEVYANSMAISIEPIEGIRIMFEKPFSVTVLFNEQSIRYDSESIMVKSTGEPPIMITSDGALILSENEQQQMIVHPNGTISRHINGEWSSVDAEGNSYIHTPEGLMVKEKDKKHSEIVDLSTGTKSMIRPDDTEYYIKSDGTRRILFSLELSIEQTPITENNPIEKTVFDIPNFPVLQKEGSQLTISLDRFEMKFVDKTVTVTCPDYTITVDEEKAFIKVSNSSDEMNLTQNRCEFKHEDRVLIADDQGIEKVCQLNVEVTGKKKIVTYDTFWGVAVPIKEQITEQQQYQLYRQFLPRFFAIRNDMTMSEFIRKDCIDTEECEEFHEVLAHPTGTECNIVTYHHPTKPAVVYFENTPMSKSERANTLKALHIPKAKKEKLGSSKSKRDMPPDEDEEEQISISESCRQALLCDNKLFVQAMNNWLEKHQMQYEEANRPIEQSEPEELHLPPPTPAPRILEKQANLYQPSAEQFTRVKNESGEILNYWESREAEFAMPLDEPRNLQKPLSPRVSLFDPPRFFREEKKKNLYEKDYSEGSKPVSRSMPALTPKTPSKNITRPVTVKATPDVINFGKVRVNTAATAQIVVTNMGTIPLHYSVTQATNSYIKVLTIPGVVFPGLRMNLKVALQPVPEPQIITTSFQLKTPKFDMSIPVTVTVVD